MKIETNGFDLRTASSREITDRMSLGAVRALRAHKAAGVAAMVWDRETNTTVLIPPEEIPGFPPEDETHPVTNGGVDPGRPYQ